MGINGVRSGDKTGNTGVANVDMKLEAIVIPASDADRSKDLYLRLGGVSTPISALRTDSEWFSSLLKTQELRFSIITDG